MARCAHTGSVDSANDNRSDTDNPPRVRTIPSSTWEENGQRFQGITGERVDPEKGRDVLVVDWWDGNDPEVSLHT